MPLHISSPEDDGSQRPILCECRSLIERLGATPRPEWLLMLCEPCLRLWVVASHGQFTHGLRKLRYGTCHAPALVLSWEGNVFSELLAVAYDENEHRDDRRIPSLSGGR